MLLQMKVYLIGIIYFLGALFMILFPPRNFELSGAKIRQVRSTGRTPFFKNYLDHKTLLAAVAKFTKSDPEVAKVLHLRPLTAENWSIVAIELRSDKQSRKPGILIIGALDGMTWGAPNAILELAEKLLYDTNYQTPFFNDYDWYLIPTGNPDGIYFTQKIQNHPTISFKEWSTNVTVRAKTRPSEWHKNIDKESEKDLCFGTNINRNFAYHWQDDVHKTPERCSQYYPGSKPFSTNEAKAIRKYIDKLSNIVHLAIHLHASFVPRKVSASKAIEYLKLYQNRNDISDTKTELRLAGTDLKNNEYILYPWRYTMRHPSNYRTLQDIGEYAARQARLPDGRLYQVHQGSSDERVAGSLTDYLSGVVGIDLVYLLKPYHQMFPNYTDTKILNTYVSKATSTILSVVRGWRSSTKQNTLSFFGRDVEF